MRLHRIFSSDQHIQMEYFIDLSKLRVYFLDKTRGDCGETKIRFWCRFSRINEVFFDLRGQLGLSPFRKTEKVIQGGSCIFLTVRIFAFLAVCEFILFCFLRLVSRGQIQVETVKAQNLSSLDTRCYYEEQGAGVCW